MVDLSKMSDEQLSKHFLVSNAKAMLQSNATELTELLSQHKAHIATFNTIRKCLNIVVDPNLMTLVIFGDIAAKHVADQALHKAISTITSDTLRRVEEAIERVPISEEKEPKELKNLPGGTVNKMMQLMHGSDNYLEMSDLERRDSVEKAIDVTLGELWKKQSPNGTADIHILFRWFEDVIRK